MVSNGNCLQFKDELCWPKDLIRIFFLSFRGKCPVVKYIQNDYRNSLIVRGTTYEF